MNPIRAVLVAMAVVASLATSVSASGDPRPRLEPWPLGTFVPRSGHPKCVTGFTCSNFAVTGCPSVSADVHGVLAQATPDDVRSIRGVVVFFSGSLGTKWWSEGSQVAAQFLNALKNRDRFLLVQIKWTGGWLAAPRGQAVGTAHLGCRPATAIEWVYEHVYLPLGITPGPGVCGFCITGNSGGASQAAYAVSHFGLADLLGAVVLTSGPPHAGEEKGCLPGFPGYEYDEDAVKLIDLSFGFTDREGDRGPCIRQDPSWIPRWEEESVDTGANDVSYPMTRVRFIIGSLDDSSAPIHAGDLRDLLLEDPANDVTWLVVDGMGHSIQSSADGLAALEDALLGS